MNDPDAPIGPDDAPGAVGGQTASAVHGGANPGPLVAQGSEETVRVRLLAGCLGHPAGVEMDVDQDDPEVAALLERGLLRLL